MENEKSEKKWRVRSIHTKNPVALYGLIKGQKARKLPIVNNISKSILFAYKGK